MNNIVGIYKVTSPTGRVYIGQSININKRFRSYYKLDCKKQNKLLNSFKKYGVENHIFETIEECVVDKLNERERYWQDFYEVLHKGLNCKLTEYSDKKGELSEATKNKISKSNKGKQDLRGDKNPMFGKKHSEESKEKMRQNLPNYKGENNPMFGKSAMKGRHHNDVTKQKLKELFTGGKSYNAKKVIDTSTGIVYEAASVAAEILGINKYTLRSYLNGHSKNKTTLIYYKGDE